MSAPRSDILVQELLRELEINSLFVSLQPDQKIALINAGQQIVCDLYAKAGKPFSGDNLGTNALVVVNVSSNLVSKFFANKNKSDTIIINFGVPYPTLVRAVGDYNAFVNVRDHADRNAGGGASIAQSPGSFTITPTDDAVDVEVLIAPLN